MWQVIQHRFIKGSDQNGRPNVIWTGGRYKEAKGQAKSALYSHLEMLDKHNHFPTCEVEIDLMDNHCEARFYDNGLQYSIRYEVKEIENG